MKEHLQARSNIPDCISGVIFGRIPAITGETYEELVNECLKKECLRNSWKEILEEYRKENLCNSEEIVEKIPGNIP